MIYRFIYDIEYARTIFGCMVEARKGTPLANQIGSVIKGCVDAEISNVTSDVIPYKIETMDGNVAGFFSLKIGPTVVLYQKVLRPAFQQFDEEISKLINNFITNNSYKGDFLS